MYSELMEAWNKRDAQRMADFFAPEGEMIGFDGSIAVGPEDIYGHLKPVFDHHPFHGRPELVEQMRQELSEVLQQRR
ncbi:SgcJ/EcaC family oxidoreductase [Paenibacillus stellifer]|uniref:SgcJ/EcaC family oxidoreductase n=1 Tax=Paenibacillus stellifer TaxID=169760 RepID=UPI00068BEE08